MHPRLEMSEENNAPGKYVKDQRDSSTEKNIRQFTDSAEYLNRLKEKEIIDDATFRLGIANIITSFIIKEINDKVYKVILKSFSS